jgi:hypothetical protein
MRASAPAGAHLAQAVHQRAVAGCQPLHVHVAKGLGEQARDDEAVFQQVAQAGRRLRALGHHPPVAVGVAGEVKRRNVQVRAAHRRHAVHGPQVAGVALHQRAGQQPASQQLLGAVHVGHDAVQQAHALQHAGFDLAPALGGNDQREQVQ